MEEQAASVPARTFAAAEAGAGAGTGAEQGASRKQPTQQSTKHDFDGIRGLNWEQMAWMAKRRCGGKVQTEAEGPKQQWWWLKKWKNIRSM